MSGGAPIFNCIVPRATRIEPIHGAFATIPEDFIVEEVLAYEPSGAGTHLYCWIEKRGITTYEAVRRIARFLDIPTHAFGFAGLKDANAVTRQWISVEHVDAALLRGWTVNDVTILSALYHPHKLRIGHSRGNRFIIKLRSAAAADFERAESILKLLLQKGLPNAYGAQRFGSAGATFEAGLALVRGDFSKFKEITGRDAQFTDRSLRSLMISSVQSELFNRVLARRMESYHRVDAGDVAFLHKNGASFVVENALAEAPRCERLEVSPSGPILGTRLLVGFGAPAELEHSVFSELSLSRESFLQLPLGHEAHGARRPLRVPIADLNYSLDGDILTLSFSLPAGSYATRVVYELTAEAGGRG